MLYDMLCTSYHRCVLRVVKRGYVCTDAVYVDINNVDEINNTCTQVLHDDYNLMSPYCLEYDDEEAALYYYRDDDVYAIINKITDDEYVRVALYRPNMNAAVHGNQEGLKHVLRANPSMNLEEIFYTSLRMCDYYCALKCIVDENVPDMVEDQAHVYKQTNDHTVYLYSTGSVNVAVDVHVCDKTKNVYAKDIYTYCVFVQPRCTNCDTCV